MFPSRRQIWFNRTIFLIVLAGLAYGVFWLYERVNSAFDRPTTVAASSWFYNGAHVEVQVRGYVYRLDFERKPEHFADGRREDEFYEERVKLAQPKTGDEVLVTVTLKDRQTLSTAGFFHNVVRFRLDSSQISNDKIKALELRYDPGYCAPNLYVRLGSRDPEPVPLDGQFQAVNCLGNL